ncbi:hypothetical protein IKI14_06690 [bacterium]|nr:hypothetical protein [bacterium]
MTDSDRKFVQKVNNIIDDIYAKHGKSKYQTKLISAFRSMVSKDTISDRKKAIYNKVLINLFTI